MDYEENSHSNQEVHYQDVILENNLDDGAVRPDFQDDEDSYNEEHKDEDHHSESQATHGDVGALLAKDRGYVSKVFTDIVTFQFVGASSVDQFKPTGKQLKTSLEFVEFGVKVQLILYEFQQILLWSSLAELYIMAIGFSIYLSSPGKVGHFIWFHIFHLVRGIVGLKILKSLPQSHDIVERLKLPANYVGFDQLKETIAKQSSENFLTALDKSPRLLFAYFLTTLICLVLGLINVVIQIFRFGNRGNEYSEIPYILISLLLVSTCVYYILWAYEVKHKLPQKIVGDITKAAFGMATNMRQMLSNDMRGARQMRERLQAGVRQRINRKK